MFKNLSLSRVVKAKAGSSHILTWTAWVRSPPSGPIPNALYVPSLLCHERFNDASLPDNDFNDNKIKIK